MNKNTGHYLKPAKRVTTPGIIFSVAVEKNKTGHSIPGGYEEYAFSHAVATVTRKRNGRWSIPTVIETESPVALFDWIIERSDSRRRNYVICPIASEVLTLTGWWHYAERKGIRYHGGVDDGDGNAKHAEGNTPITCRRCILRGKPDIFDYLEDGRRFVWLSGIQFSTASEQSIAESIGFKRGNGLFDSMDETQQCLSTFDRAMLWSQFLCHLSNWWAECSTAPFGLTVGSLAMGILRSHVAPKTLTTHKDEYVHKLERSACYGGRASVWYVGSVGSTPSIPIRPKFYIGQRSGSDVPSPVRLIDVRSMYPFILSGNLFPCSYVGRIGNVSGDELQSIAAHYGVIAYVKVYSDSGEYPYRYKERIAYPRGYFQTVLTGPEILSIKGKDKILICYEGAKYKMGEPYKDAAKALLEMRIRARAERNGAWELFAKSVGNNLGGKLAQRRSFWKPRPDVPPKKRWGEWIESNHSLGTSTRFRSRAGLVDEYIRDKVGYGPYTASFAYLTAYGRLYMRTMREKLPSHTVLSQDTDGIWVAGDDAYAVLRDTFPFGNDPGQLAVKNKTNSCLFLSPRHYYTDSGWVLAGFTTQDVDSENMTVRDTVTFNPLIGGSSLAPSTVLLQERVSALALDHVGGEINPYGWVSPLYIPEDKVR